MPNTTCIDAYILADKTSALSMKVLDKMKVFINSVQKEACEFIAPIIFNSKEEELHTLCQKLRDDRREKIEAEIPPPFELERSRKYGRGYDSLLYYFIDSSELLDNERRFTLINRVKGIKEMFAGIILIVCDGNESLSYDDNVQLRKLLYEFDPVLPDLKLDLPGVWLKICLFSTKSSDGKNVHRESLSQLIAFMVATDIITPVSGSPGLLREKSLPSDKPLMVVTFGLALCKITPDHLIEIMIPRYLARLNQQLKGGNNETDHKIDFLPADQVIVNVFQKLGTGFISPIYNGDVCDDIPAIVTSRNNTDKRFSIRLRSESELKLLRKKPNSQVISRLKTLSDQSMKKCEAIKPKVEKIFQSLTESETSKIKERIIDKVICSPEIAEKEIEPLIAKINGSYSENIQNAFHSKFDEALHELENLQTSPTSKTLLGYFMLALLGVCVAIGIDIGMASIPLHFGYRICLFGCLVLSLTAYFFVKVWLPYQEKCQAIAHVLQAVEQQIQSQICTLMSSYLIAHYKKLAEKVEKWVDAIPKICQKITLPDSEFATVKKNHYNTSSIFHLPESSREIEYADYFINRFGCDEEVKVTFKQMARRIASGIMDGDSSTPDLDEFEAIARRTLVPLIRQEASFLRLLSRDFSEGGVYPENVKKMVEKLQNKAKVAFLGGKTIESVLWDSTKARLRYFIPNELETYVQGSISAGYEVSPFDNCCFIVQTVMLAERSWSDIMESAQDTG